MFGHVLRAKDEDPIREICFLHDTATPNTSQEKIRGRPKLNWVTTQMHQVWPKVKQTQGIPENTKFNISNRMHQDHIRAAANDYVF